MGTVDDPSKVEWAEAFNAPSRPYRWQDESRLTIRNEVFRQFYVARWIPGPVCDCRAAFSDMVQPEYERVPAEITRRNRPLTHEEKLELEACAEAAENRDDQCSVMFAMALRFLEEQSGETWTSAVREIADRIERLHNKGMHLRPTMVARVLREFAKD